MPGRKHFTAKTTKPAQLSGAKQPSVQSEALPEAAVENDVPEIEFAKSVRQISENLTPSRILGLQNTLGNQAVQRLIAEKHRASTAPAQPANRPNQSIPQPIQRMLFDDLPQSVEIAGKKYTQTCNNPKGAGSKRTAIIMFIAEGGEDIHFSIVRVGSAAKFNEFHITFDQEHRYFFKENGPGAWEYDAAKSTSSKSHYKQATQLGSAFAKALGGAQAAAAQAASNTAPVGNVYILPHLRKALASAGGATGKVEDSPAGKNGEASAGAAKPAADTKAQFKEQTGNNSAAGGGGGKTQSDKKPASAAGAGGANPAAKSDVNPKKALVQTIMKRWLPNLVLTKKVSSEQVNAVLAKLTLSASQIDSVKNKLRYEVKVAAAAAAVGESAASQQSVISIEDFLVSLKEVTNGLQPVLEHIKDW